MFSSPSPTKSGGGGAPAKTPGGWARALGIFSSSKKSPSSPSVESGTNVTSEMNGEIAAVTRDPFRGSGASSSSSGLNTSVSSDADPYMSPISPSMSPGKASGMTNNNNNNINTSSIAGGAASRTPRLDFAALSSRMSTSKANSKTTTTTAAAAPNQLVAGGGGGDQMTLRNTKSPWQSRQQNSAAGFSANLSVKSPWQGNRSRRSRNNNDTTAKPLTFLSSSTRDRARRYRPNAIGLVGGATIGRRYRKAGECKPENISQALVQLKDSFLVPQNQDTSTNVYAVRGKVQWGSSSRPNRLPRPSQKRQRPVQEAEVEDHEEDEEDHEGTSRKRRKKVSFDQETDDAVVTRITATPFRSVANRRGTPMPSRTNQSTPTSTGTADSSFVSPRSSTNNRDEPMSSSSSTRQDNLPRPPPRLDFPVAKLDSDQPITLNFAAPQRKSFDAVNLDPMAKDMQFNWKQQSQASKEAARSFTEKSEYEATRYERPPSPVRVREKKTSTENDDDGTSEQSAKRTRVSQNQEDEKMPDWVCDCGHVNDSMASNCANCGKLRMADPNAPTSWGNTFSSMYAGMWRCDVCTAYNNDSFDKCQACGADRGAKGVTNKPKEGEEGAASASASAPAPSMPATTSFPEDFAKAAKTTKFTFGSRTPSLPVPTGKPEDSQFTFPSTGGTNGSTTATGGFIFDAAPAPAASTASTTKGFIFNSGGSAPAPAPVSKGSFVFGKTSNGDEEKKEASKPNFMFGTPAPSTTAPAPQTGGFKFGSSNDDKKSPTVKAAGPAPVPATDGKKSTPLSATAKPFAPFNASSGENGDKKPAAAGFGFGKMGATDQGGSATKASVPSPAFGASDSKSSEASKPAASTPGAGPSPAPFSFNQKKSTPAPAPAPAQPFNFGAKSNTTPAAPAAPFAFGSTPAAPAPAPDGSKRSNSAPFGSTPAPAPPPKSDKKPKRQRGYDLNGTKSVEPKAPKPGPTLFGAPTPGPAAAPSNNSKPFVFGAAKADVPAGGAMGSAPAPSAPFGNSAPTPAPGVKFGSTPAPPAATTTSFSFGGATAPTPAPPPAAAATGFGASATPAPAAPLFGGAPTFGNAPAPAPAGFGSGAPPPATTTFGSNPAPAATTFGSTTPAPAMSFGSTPAPAPTGGMNFGSTPGPAPASGMNFGSATATAPAPAATGGFGAPGGFSGFGSAKPAAAPGPAFGATANPPAAGFAFGSQTPAPPSQGFNPGAFGNNAAPSTGGFGAATPAPSAGFGGGGFGAPQTGGFPSTTTPAPSGGGFGGGGFPQTAPPQQGGFNIGSTNASNKTNTRGRRRIIKAKRPGASKQP